MASAPFKIAFWVMSLAFGLTVLLTGLKPEEVRTALHQSSQVSSPNYQSFMGAATKWTSEPHLPAVLQTQQPEQQPQPRAESNRPGPAARPTKNQSPQWQNDLSHSTGSVTHASSSQTQACPEQSQRRSQPVQLVFADPDDLPLEMTQPDASDATPIEIADPDPLTPASPAGTQALSDSLSQLKAEMLQLRLTEARRGVEELRRQQAQSDVEFVEKELAVLRRDLNRLKAVSNSRESQATAESQLATQPPASQHPTTQPAPMQPIVSPANTLPPVTNQYYQQQPVDHQPPAPQLTRTASAPPAPLSASPQEQPAEPTQHGSVQWLSGPNSTNPDAVPTTELPPIPEPLRYDRSKSSPVIPQPETSQSSVPQPEVAQPFADLIAPLPPSSLPSETLAPIEMKAAQGDVMYPLVDAVSSPHAEPEVAMPVLQRVSPIEIEPGRVAETFTFKFENADIRDVLKATAEAAQWRVVLDPEIHGDFTGEFTDIRADQAFATIIKLHEFGISMRGDFMIVRSERGPRRR